MSRPMRIFFVSKAADMHSKVTNILVYWFWCTVGCTKKYVGTSNMWMYHTADQALATSTPSNTLQPADHEYSQNSNFG